MNRQERVTQIRKGKKRSGREGWGGETDREREREYLYTFAIILNWLYILKVFFSNAETSLNGASFSWCTDKL